MPRFLPLAWLPLGLAVVGALLDERRALGFTIWRAACRGAGLTPTSFATFTLELLPNAIIGALLGSMVVLFVGLDGRVASTRDALAAHAGCMIAMPAGLVLCVTALPWPITLAAEATLAALAAAAVWWFTRIRKATYPRGPARVVPRIPASAAAAENFSVNHSWNPHDC